MDVSLTPGIVDFSAVAGEHYPIARPKRPGEGHGDRSLDRAKTANVGTIHMRDRLRHRAADADDKKETREGLDEMHRYQHSTGVFLILVTERSRTGLSWTPLESAGGSIHQLETDAPLHRCVAGVRGRPDS
jgi:hypothetical protein